MVYMQLPQWLARFNRHVTNPIQRLWAGWAAGGGPIKRYGKTIDVTDPRVVSKAEAAPSVAGLWRPIFARLPFEQAVLLTRV
jgi:hypothetical protein